MSNDKGEVLKNNAKKCPYCGSTSTLPIAHGLMTDEAIQENAKDRKWVWGGCVVYKGGNTVIVMIVANLLVVTLLLKKN